jgi:hypothetical protein
LKHYLATILLWQAALFLPALSAAENAPDSGSVGIFDAATGSYATCLLVEGIGSGLWQVVFQGQSEPDLGPEFFSFELLSFQESDSDSCGSVFDVQSQSLTAFATAINAPAELMGKTFLFQARRGEQFEGIRLLSNLNDDFIEITLSGDDAPVEFEVVSNDFNGQALRYNYSARPDSVSLNLPQCKAFVAAGDVRIDIPAQMELSASAGLNYSQSDDAVTVIASALPAGSYSLSAQCTATIGESGFASPASLNLSAGIEIVLDEPTGPINQAPSFNAGPDQVVLEESGAQVVPNWATAISPGPVSEAGQSVSFIVTANSNPDLFASPPQVDSTGSLSYTPAANTHGTATISVALQDDGGTAFGGSDTSASQTFTITVNDINDAPSFNKGADQTVLENAGAQTVAAWATAIDKGAPSEADQSLSFVITGNTAPGLFAAGPAVSADGSLSYTPATDANGTATITLQLQDDGGTANGGIDTSASQSFLITVTAVNNAPVFNKGPDQTVPEDAGAQTIPAWATGISAGAGNESGQTLTFNITANSAPSLFAAGPAIASNGDLTFTPAANVSGSATLTVELADDGGTANGGVDTSASQDFVITINPVNDAPLFTVGSDQTIAEDAGAQSVSNWATAISAGPADEAAQSLNFNITNNTNAALFAAGPSIASDGSLSYTPAADANGTATITVTLSDDGGTANGGVDTSASETFDIVITPENDNPVANAQSVSTEEDTAITINLTGTDVDGDDLTFAIASAPGKGSLGSITDTGLSTAQVTYTPATESAYSTSFTFTVSDGTVTSAPATVNVTVTSINDRPTVEINGSQIISQTGSLEGSTSLIAIASASDLEFEFGDAEALDSDDNARAPYYFILEPLSWPASSGPGDDTPFTLTNFDEHVLSSDRIIISADFDSDFGGLIQWTSSIGISNLILNDLQLTLKRAGEFRFGLTVLDNGFLGACPAGLTGPDAAELDDMDHRDYRKSKFRETDLLNGDSNRCIREARAVIRLSNNSGGDVVVTFTTAP